MGPWFANVSVTNVAERLKVGWWDAKPTDLEMEVIQRKREKKVVIYLIETSENL